MKIAVFGNYGVSNLGDELILQGIRQEYPDHDLMVFCGNPKEVQGKYGFESHSFFPGGARSWLRYLFSSAFRREIQQGFEALKTADLILIGGGGILVDRHLKAVALWFSQLRIIAKTRVPFEFVGNSFELKKWVSRWLFTPFLKQALRITVRDKGSQEFVESIGLKAELVDDLSVHASLPVHERKQEKRISLALCRWGFNPERVKVFQEFVRQKKEQGYEIIGLAFQTDGDDDRKILAALDPGMEIKTGLEEVLDVLRTSEAVIAMRYHAVVLAHRLKIPFLAISYQEKVKNFMDDKGLQDRCLSIQDVNAESLQGHFKKIVEGVKE